MSSFAQPHSKCLLLFPLQINACMPFCLFQVCEYLADIFCCCVNEQFNPIRLVWQAFAELCKISAATSLQKPNYLSASGLPDFTWYMIPKDRKKCTK
jgi:hypothetical protein